MARPLPLRVVAYFKAKFCPENGSQREELLTLTDANFYWQSYSKAASR